MEGKKDSYSCFHFISITLIVHLWDQYLNPESDEVLTVVSKVKISKISFTFLMQFHGIPGNPVGFQVFHHQSEEILGRPKIRPSWTWRASSSSPAARCESFCTGIGKTCLEWNNSTDLPHTKIPVFKEIGKEHQNNFVNKWGWRVSHDCCLEKATEKCFKKKRGGGDEGNNELNEIISTLWFVSEKKTETFGTMERETDGCLLQDKNSITSINLLLSLIYLYFIINSNVTA